MAVITPEYLARSGTEHGEQTAFFCWASMVMRDGFTVANNMGSYEPGIMKEMLALRKQFAYPELRWMYAIPNGGGRTAIQGAQLKAEGVKGGVADIFLPSSIGDYSGLYIEMKKADGAPSDVSKDQYEFGAHVTSSGYAWYVAFGWKEAAKILEGYILQQDVMISTNQQKVHDKMMEMIDGR